MTKRPAFPAALRIAAAAVLLSAGSVLAAPEDDFNAGEKAYRSGDMVSAMPALKRAADAGHAKAQVLYGYIMDQAEFNEDAAQYYRRAADQGNADGMYSLATLYAAGEGVTKDAKAARELFERAAKQGHAQSVNALAGGYMTGTLGFNGAADAEGVAWARKAADQNHVPAIEHLAKAYRSGSLGAVDIAEAERLEARMRELLGSDKKGRRRSR
jgi:TPR repeat protein